MFLKKTLFFLFFSASLMYFTGCDFTPAVNDDTEDPGDDDTDNPDDNLIDEWGNEYDYSDFEYLTPLSPVDFDAGGFQQGLVTGRYYKDMTDDPNRFWPYWNSMELGWIRIEFEEFMYVLKTDIDLYDPSTWVSVMEERVSRYKFLINEAHRRGIRVLAVMGTNGMPGGLEWEWTLEDKSDIKITQETLDRYTGALRWHIETYGIDAVEIWNEPWGYGFGASDGNIWKLPGYSELLIASYETVQSLDNPIPVVGPVTANAETGEWIGTHWINGIPTDIPGASIFNSDVMQAYRDNHNGDLPLDWISWHPYGTVSNPLPDQNFYYGQDLETFINSVLAYEDIAGRPIITDQPVIFSEFGWDSRVVSAATAETYYQSFYNQTEDMPQVKAIMYYTFLDDEDVAGTEHKQFGLIKNSEYDFVRKNIYYRFYANSSGIGKTAAGTYYPDFVKEHEKRGGKSFSGAVLGPVYTSGQNLIQPFEKYDFIYNGSIFYTELKD
ncbi:MAG: hypothetical protein JXR86_18215 [Spirochaetales bacterium]|nr:hypothetical protein [Spirochaetales bacterium]